VRVLAFYAFIFELYAVEAIFFVLFFLNTQLYFTELNSRTVNREQYLAQTKNIYISSKMINNDVITLYLPVCKHIKILIANEKETKSYTNTDYLFMFCSNLYAFNEPFIVFPNKSIFRPKMT
jgi:hypothetical protein